MEYLYMLLKSMVGSYVSENAAEVLDRGNRRI